MMDMRERKYIKFRVDMHEDTKFKIIDMKPERDVIHYVWTRIVTLAAKVNLDGDLYLSKNIPYTIETLAIEFNRDIAQIKLALEVFIELEMIEITEDNIYRVKNFAKHQNIKVKEKGISENKEDDVKSINEDISSGNLQDNDPIILETKKSKKNTDKVPDINTIDEEFEDNSICCLTDGVRPLGDGERTVLEWSFG